jgi:hypothetical protein
MRNVLLVFVLTAAPLAAGAQSFSRSDQIGIGNHSSISQTGLNVASSAQIGIGNRATISQNGTGNAAAVAQIGSGLSRDVTQDGSMNGYGSFQRSHDSVSVSSSRTGGNADVSVTFDFDID